MLRGFVMLTTDLLASGPGESTKRIESYFIRRQKRKPKVTTPATIANPDVIPFMRKCFSILPPLLVFAVTVGCDYVSTTTKAQLKQEARETESKEIAAKLARRHNARPFRVPSTIERVFTVDLQRELIRNDTASLLKARLTDLIETNGIFLAKFTHESSGTPSFTLNFSLICTSEQGRKLLRQRGDESFAVIAQITNASRLEFRITAGTEEGGLSAMAIDSSNDMFYANGVCLDLEVLP
jgi:hypothetical protein